MSAQVCPVCGGKGLVPNGFYDVGSNTHTTTSATPETCRSCGGKGYIIEYSDSCQIPVYNVSKSCSICNRNDGMCYMSNPPKYRCTLDGEFHDGHYSCDKFDNTPTYRTIKGKVVENYDMKLNSTSNKGCSTCTNSDGNRYMVRSFNDVYGETKYKCLLDGSLHLANHNCKDYKCNQNSDK